MEKICFKCKRMLPLSEFYPHPNMADGHLNKCKECNCADVQQNRRRKVNFYREYDRLRTKQPERITLRRNFHRRQKEMEPEKYYARTVADNALRDGRLTKDEYCYFCNSSDNLEMHHPDYSQPLRIYWLCRICHRKLDNMQKLGISHDNRR